MLVPKVNFDFHLQKFHPVAILGVYMCMYVRELALKDTKFLSQPSR